MVKNTVIVGLLFALLLFLSACTEPMSAENDEMPPPCVAVEGATTEEVEDIKDACEITEYSQSPAYYSDDTAIEYDAVCWHRERWYEDILCETCGVLGCAVHPPPFIITSWQFHRKYWFDFSQPIEGGQAGSVINNWWPPLWPSGEWFYEPARPYTISSDFGHQVFIADGGRVTVPGSPGWPGPLRDTAYEVDSGVEIRVAIRNTIRDDGTVTIISNPGVLTQLPEFLEDEFSSNLLVGGGRSELQDILYIERENSSLWQWLMNEENAWRITVQDPRPFADIFQDVSGDLWHRHGIQIFLYAGNATIMTRRGILSQMPELHEDNLYFNLYGSGDFEMQYIMLHEKPESMLWQRMIEMRG